RIDDVELKELMRRAAREPEISQAVERVWPRDSQAWDLRLARARAATKTAGPRRPHWSLMFLPTGLAASMVAAVSFVTILALQAPPLPDYTLEIQGGIRDYRGPDLVVGRFVPKAKLTLVFRPAEEVESEVRAAIFRVGSKGLVPLDHNPDISGLGSVRWRSMINNLFPDAEGPVELIMAVKAGKHPPSVRDVQAALNGATSSVRIAKTTLLIEEQ
ncbi:MAG: hypothetical protein AAF449_06365, partial [Myxococcota bacterium]